MSVMILKPTVFKYLSLAMYKSTFQREHNAWFSDAANFFNTRPGDTMSSLLDFSYRLMQLNEESYRLRYNLKTDKKAIPEAKIEDFENLEPIQAIKYCDAILYNLEMAAIAASREVSDDEMEDINHLRMYRDDLTRNLVVLTDAYENAKYDE